MAVRLPSNLLRFPPQLFLIAATSTSTNSSSESRKPMAYTTLNDRVRCEKEIKKSRFIAIASPIYDELSAQSFLNEVRDTRATHNCWAYKLGDQYRSNDDGEPSGTAGKPIYSAINSSGIDMVIVVVIRYFGGIKLGTGGLVRAYGGVASDCLKLSTTCLIKPKVQIGLDVPFDLLGVVYHQLQSLHVEDIQQDYDSGKEGVTVVTFRVEYDKVEMLETAIKAHCSRDILFYK